MCANNYLFVIKLTRDYRPIRYINDDYVEILG
jgi:hypothetical protein